MKKIGIIIQARMGSSRLPGKILLESNGKSFFLHQIERLKKIEIPLFIATTNKIQDDLIQDFSIKNDLPFFRGDENNVLSRYYGCALENNLDIIVRVTSDCPLIDAPLILESVNEYLSMNLENIYYSNAIERTYPRGFDFEIFSFELLKDAYNNALDVSDLEHVTPYIWKNKSGRVNIKHKINDVDNSKYRLTLDTKEDQELLNILIEKYNAHDITGERIVEILDNNPQLVQINAFIEQKKV